MEIFQDEQVRIDKRIDAFLPQLEYIGQQGSIVVHKLYDLTSALKSHQNNGQNLYGSEQSTANARDDFQTIKSELEDYAEKSAALIKDLTKLLTETRWVMRVRD